MRTLLLLSLLTWFSIKAFAQSGCTDPKATNYDASATVNNGSCVYSKTDYALTRVTSLPAVLKESSGLSYADGKLWTHTDSEGAAAIYQINQVTGAVVQTVNITNATNIDWEDITADANYLYVGDFGNNASGNRTDLRIYKIKKTDITADAVVNVTAEIINFSYPIDPVTNTSQYDCEAFFYTNNQLHLFTKAWRNSGNYTTSHYTLPISAGTHTAVYKDSFNVNGLVTGADISTTNTGEIVLVGYTNDLTSVFMWLFFDYTSDNFFSGNKRKIELGSSLNSGQIEGVTFTDFGNGYISSEEVNQVIAGFPINIPSRLYSFSTTAWIPQLYIPTPVDLMNFTAVYTDPNVEVKWQTASETNNDHFTVERSGDSINFTAIGTVPAAGKPGTQNYSFIDTSPVNGTSYYRLKQTDTDSKFAYSKIISVSTVTSIRKGRQLNHLKIYPNPADRGMIMRIEAAQFCCHTVTLSLTSLDGRVVFRQTAQPTTAGLITFPTDTIKTGLYLLQITGKDWIAHQKVHVF